MNLLKVKSPIYAALVALVLVVSQSAFKPAKTDVLYGKDYNPTTGWKDLTGINVDNSFPYAENTYSCVAQEDETCTGEFDSTTPPTSSTSTPTGDSHEGLFICTPEEN